MLRRYRSAMRQLQVDSGGTAKPSLRMPAPVLPDSAIPPAADSADRFRTSTAHARGRSPAIRLLAKLSSMWTAAFLIAVIAAVLGTATYYERAFGRLAAAQVIYHAVWFQALWALIALNIFGAAAVRFPWRRRQWGFVIVHVGLLTLMAGFWISAYRLDGSLVVPTGTTESTIRGDRDRLTVVENENADARRIAISFQALPLTSLPSFPRFAVSPLFPMEPPGLRRGEPLGVLLSSRTQDRWLRDALLCPPDFPRITVTGSVLWGAPELALGVGTAEDPPAVKVTLRIRPPGQEEQVLPPIFLSEAGEKESDLGIVTVGLARTRSRLLAADLLKPADQLAAERTVVVYRGETSYRVLVGDTFPHQVELTDDLAIEMVQALERPVFNDEQLSDDPQGALEPLLIVRVGEGKGAERKWRMAPVFAFHPASLSVLPANPDAAELRYEHPVLHSGGAGQGVTAVAVLTPDNDIVLHAISRTRGCLPGQRLAAGATTDWALVQGAAMPMQGIAQVTFFAHARAVPQPIVVAGKNAERATRWLEIEAQRGNARGRAWVARSDGGSGSARISLDDGSAVLVRYDPEIYDLITENGFSVRLERFIERRDPGGTKVAGYESDISILPVDGQPQPRRISMNEPLTWNGVTLYQSSFEPERDAQGMPIPGRYQASVFTAATDPGRFCKYLGSLTLVAGMVLMYLLNRRLPVTR